MDPQIQKKNASEQDPQPIPLKNCLIFRGPGRMIVWRVQNGDGFGPYSVIDDLGYKHSDEDHPGWRQELNGEFVDHKLKAGFLDPKSAHEWFKKDWKVLNRHGMRLVCRLARKVWLLPSQKQVIFLPDADTVARYA